ncbi:hypothetical protein HMPREF1989_00107 [Porphyromonas gingivalis F0566]|nr:hypothetical protein HMPREF1989_00107 [Porphyromonas gingivalis F0566]
MFLGRRKVKQTFFSQIDTIIDWPPIRGLIEAAYTKGCKTQVGRAMAIWSCSR